MQFSHSRIDTFEKCKFKYKVRYVDGIKTDDPIEPDSALVLGQAVHTGIDKGVEAAIREYYFSYPVITDEHVNEAIKLETVIPLARAALPTTEGDHLYPDDVKEVFEYEISNEHFHGFIDFLFPMYPSGDGVQWYDLYDFKYSNNVAAYINSDQLHLYKYFFERDNPGKKIRNMYFLFVPKVKIRQKKTETLQDFRERLQAELETVKVQTVQVEFNYNKVIEFLLNIKAAQEETEFAAEKSYLCRFCEYQEFCEKGWDYFMQLPKNERRNIEEVKKRVIWIYGAPFCGKTTFANGFPDPLMLNTDGNIKFVDAPYIHIKDEVKVEGRQTKRTLAWDVFKDVVAELEKKDNTFKTIVVDLLEDLYEHCRLYMYQQMGITHESDDSFRAWDKVRGEFLHTLRKLMNLDYENIILISHEDTTKDITKKGGDKITSIKPNMQDKVAVKVAGMVDVVARIVADGSERSFCFKSNEVIFGGGRLKVDAKDIPLDVDALFAVYDEANKNAAAGTQPQTKTSGRGKKRTAEAPAQSADEPQDKPEKARSRNKSADAEKPQETADTPADGGVNVCEKDTYFHIPETDNYVMKHKGDIVPDGAVEITKEQFVEGGKRIAQEENPVEGAMNPPEPAEQQEERPRRRRKARD